MVTADTTTSQPSTGAVHAVQAKFRIPGEKIRAAVRELPEDQRNDVLWFASHCRRHDLDKAALGRLLRKPAGGYYSADSIIQLLSGGRGRRGESTEVIHAAIVALRRVEEPRQEQVHSGFIETRLFAEIERRSLKALSRNRILYIFGDSQIGKTESLLEVQRRHNHGQTIYIEVPCGGSLGSLLIAFAEALDIRTTKNQREIKEAVLTSLDSNNLLILDEAHRFFEGRSKHSGLSSLSFIRQLWNRTKCGMVISMTRENKSEFLTGRHAKALEQMWRRRITPLFLPPSPPDDDAAKFAVAYGLEPASDKTVAVKLTTLDQRGREQELVHRDNPLRLQRQVLADEGLGVWIGILQDASDMATESKRKISWAAVIKAHAQSQADAEIFT